MNTETPKTDAEAMDGEWRSDQGCRMTLATWDYKKDKDGHVVPADFARELEREIRRLKQTLEGIANMPEYDQDDALRLRYQAKMSLPNAVVTNGRDD